MAWLWVLLGSTFGMASIGFLLEALFGSHDPGAVFPWAFVAVMMAFAGGGIGLALGGFADLLNLFFRWW